MKSKRRLRRFFSSAPLPASGASFSIPPDEARHLKTIIRLKEGDSCLVADGTGKEAVARVEVFPPDGSARLVVEKSLAVSDGLHPVLKVFQALPRHDKFEDIIQKAQELGVQELVPLHSERTVVKIEEKKKSSKLARWHKIAAEAAKQSGVLRLTEIKPPVTLEEAERLIPAGGIVLLFHPHKKAVPFRRWLDAYREDQDGGPLHLFLGPEGGFSEKEVSRLEREAQNRGWIFAMVGLGDTILKSDTAFIAAAAALRLVLSSGAQEEKDS
ncbi:MAG TPA: RsmE family RNA methyltransferase [Verrucomicrobiae bacterium]|jgi:16S rRNA (uracil1498-N3)-methyltransferase|nr:RsmE family RNA methyltransferase [Verrucomicrobiae bacterium]